MKDRQQLVLREFFAAAAGENGAVRDSLIVRIGRNAHFRKCRRQTDFFDERRKSVDKCVRKFCFRLSGRINAPNIQGETSKLGRSFRKHMAVEDGMNRRQPLPVVAVGVGAELVFQHVRLKICDLADFEHPVFAHGRRPYKLAARADVLRVFD